MNARAVIFAGRNAKELLRSPVSWIFGLALPVGLFVIMQVIIKSVGADAAANVPMFGVARFTGGALLFGASFLGMFCAILISNDCAQSFLARLSVSPMTSFDFIAGYALAVLPIAALQNAITLATALCFGLAPTVNILPTALFSLLFSLLFIAIGIIFGSALGVKTASPVCSAVVQAAALLSGMWFDLDAIGGGFAAFCRALPFANVYDLARYALAGEWAKTWQPFSIAAAYTVVLIAVAVLVFTRRRKSK